MPSMTSIKLKFNIAPNDCLLTTNINKGIEFIDDFIISLINCPSMRYEFSFYRNDSDY